MGLCKANRGNLMQHWVLCELLRRLGQRDFKHLMFICTHSMAPWSVPERRDDEARNRCRQVFHLARRRIGNQRINAYEEAWFALSASDGLPYPSSAMFVKHLWKEKLSLLLCEAAHDVSDEIDGWLGTPGIKARLEGSRLSRGDWRLAFSDPFTAGDADVLIIEMDPMRFEHHSPHECSRKDRAVLFPEDLDLTTTALSGLTIPVLVQISSFSANNGNSHQIVEQTTTARLRESGFTLLYRAMVGGQMLTLIYGRHADSLTPSPDFETAFATWLTDIG